MKRLILSILLLPLFPALACGGSAPKAPPPVPPPPEMQDAGVVSARDDERRRRRAAASNTFLTQGLDMATTQTQGKTLLGM